MGGGLESFNLGIMSIQAVENKCRICVLKCIYYKLFITINVVQ